MRRATRFEVEGPVRGQARPRFGRGRAYKGEADRAWEARILAAFLEAGGEQLAGPVRVQVDVWRRLPLGAPRREERRPDTVRPDLDNVCKSVLDALNGHAWKDDSQVVELWAVKHERTRRGCDLMRVTVAPA